MKYRDNFDKVINHILKASHDAAKETAQKGSDMIAKSFAEDKSGEVYDYGQASAPYEEPAIATGELLSSLAVRRVSQATYDFGATDPKAPLLEDGTVNMEPRPFMAPIEKPLRKVLRDKVKDKFGRI
jgi:hypothetical protein